MRPLHPPLPRQWMSKALRVAMSADDWARFDDLVRRSAGQAPTQARAHGIVLSELLEKAPGALRPAPGPLDWMDWERKKTLRLLDTAV